MSEETSILGTGWSFPPRFFGGGAGVETVSAEDDVRQSLEILLSTDAGERLMIPDYGCDLSRFLYEEIDSGLVTHMKSMIHDAILYYEPRIEVKRLDISQADALEGVLNISLDYVVRATNTRYNMVYPFYLNEADAPL